MKKRIIAMALCLAMTLSLFPTGAFANPENEPAAPSSETVAELVQEQQTEALPEAAAETEKTENEAPAVPVTAEAEIAAEAEKADAEPTTEPAKADSKPAEPEKAESEASSEPEKADSEPVESEAETAKEPAAENSGSKWDALKNSIGNLFGGAVQPFSITPDLKVDTYEFYVDDVKQENWTQRVAKGDTLKIPGTPKKDGYVFEGWFIGEQKLTDGMTPTVTGGETVRVDAKFKAVSYVHFMGTDGTTVVHTVQGTSGEAVSEADISTAAEMVRLTLGAEQSVQGWSETKGDSTPLENIVFTEGTLTLYPVEKTGYWVTFNSDGGSYIAPKFSIEGETLDLSDIKPTKAGYDFVGWYLNEQKVTSVDGAATVTASWKAKDAQYTVIYWQENADDDEYSFAESETKKGTAGTVAEASQKPYEGFTLNTAMSETKTIAGDGSTILNVYYKRNVYEVNFYKTCGKEEHKHEWWCYAFGHLVCGQEEHTHTDDCRKLAHSISAKYGANISKKWPGGTWSVNADVSKGPWQVHIDTMPMGGKNFYGPKTGDGSETAYYYVEVLPDESGEKASDGRVYKLHHKDTSPGTGYRVSEEDRYPITGFTLVEDISTKIRGWYNNAKFYYSRNSYDIVFYSGNTIVHRESRQFQQSIADVNYKPEKPDNIPANYQFAGWYANQLCEGDAFKFEGTMPAKNITLYAKWAAPQITVTIPMKDGTNKEITVPYGSKLGDSAEWNALAEKLQPDAWMIDGMIFNLDTELYENITLTPYYISDATQCTITYDENGTKWDDLTKYAKGGKATILNPEHSEGLKFQHWKLDNNTTLLPGQSITVTGDVTLTAVYGEPPENLTLTYHNGDKTKVFENLPANSKQTAADPARLGQDFETPEGKKFAGWATTKDGEAEYQAGNKFCITKDGNNDLYAIWKDLPDISDKNVASINDPTNVTYDGNSHQWEPTVTKAGTQVTLKKDTDYTVSYSTDDFTNVTGTITVTITGIGDYTGKVEKTYQITKRNVTLTSASAEKVYDETPLTKHDVAVTGDGFVKDEGATYNVTGSQTVAGGEEGNNTFTYTLKDNTNADNYNVTTVNGTLKVTAKGVTADGMTVEKPADVKYNGESQQQKPVVKDGDKVLKEDTDYTLSYSADTTNAGTVTVTVTGKGNYSDETTVTYQITPATLKITTNSAEKTYDESALTAGGKIEGLVKGETATLKTTGSQTEVGSSKNTYEIEWGTAKASNYEITEDIGTLTVNKRSGGGSSSKPTPEEEPTPTPTPTPLPTLPTTPAPTTPARRVTRSTATVTEPASRPTEQITENETPKAESEPEVIEDEETPLAPMATGAWALVNLILMLLTVLASLLLLLGYLGKKKYAKEDEYGNALHDANGNEIIDYTRNKKGFWRVASLIPAIAAVIAFALTENMRLPMVMTDRWTLLMVIIAVVQLIVAVLCKKKKESEEDENQANA
ncbi:MAG: InlB B-repeat-containing protein [Subdoligranulum sp.]|nr:InlB B-repeat-containing protein [Subdoligranulum sp.]